MTVPFYATEFDPRWGLPLSYIKIATQTHKKSRPFRSGFLCFVLRGCRYQSALVLRRRETLPSGSGAAATSSGSASTGTVR